MWIKTSDRLPKKGERVIAFSNDLGILSSMLHIGYYGHWMYSQMNTRVLFQDRITHWMPLPDLPITEKK